MVWIKPTGIDLPNETSGKIAYTYPIEKATTAFGQGTAITPIQQVQALTAVANDGNMMKPHVIDKIVDPDSGETIKDNTDLKWSVPQFLKNCYTSKGLFRNGYQW